MRRVGLNAHLLSLTESYRGAGVSQYIYQLLTHLPHVDPSFDYVAFVGDPDARFSGWQESASAWRTAQPVARILWEQVAQPWASRRERLDLLHAPVYAGPLVCTCPLVVTIHDLSFALYPEMFPPFNRSYLQRATRWTANRAAAIITGSESAKGDILYLLGVPEAKVRVIPDGVAEEMHPIDAPGRIDALRRRYALPERMILFLGTLEPRKNITTLIEAYALLRHDTDMVHRLVIAGGKGWYYEQVYAAVKRLGLDGDVVFPGFIPQEELALLYNAADLFVYPSLYEGFGLPPLEAMACGTPVVVSNTSSLPEVVGDAGVTVDPSDAEALAGAIWDLLRQPERCRALSEAGLARAKRFSWNTTAARTAALYLEILEDR
jgi:glycosyltransferase involved in cell wall biosynthesis